MGRFRCSSSEAVSPHGSFGTTASSNLSSIRAWSLKQSRIVHRSRKRVLYGAIALLSLLNGDEKPMRILHLVLQIGLPQVCCEWASTVARALLATSKQRENFHGTWHFHGPEACLQGISAAFFSEDPPARSITPSSLTTPWVRGIFQARSSMGYTPARLSFGRRTTLNCLCKLLPIMISRGR